MRPGSMEVVAHRGLLSGLGLEEAGKVGYLGVVGPEQPSSNSLVSEPGLMPGLLLVSCLTMVMNLVLL